MSRPNLHVGLALALGVQPDRSDKQLLGMVEELVRRGRPGVEPLAPPEVGPETAPLFEVDGVAA